MTKNNSHTFYLTANSSEKSLLSVLWIFLVGNLLFCELLTFMHCYAFDNQLTSNIDGLHISKLALLVSALLMEIPLIMILVSRFCKRKYGRILNIISAFLLIFVELWSLTIVKNTLHQWFFFALEILTCIVIIWIAFNWKKRERVYIFDEECRIAKK